MRQRLHYANQILVKGLLQCSAGSIPDSYDIYRYLKLVRYSIFDTRYFRRKPTLHTDIVGTMDAILDQLGLADLKIAFKDNKVKILKIKYKRCVSCILTVLYKFVPKEHVLRSLQ